MDALPPLPFNCTQVSNAPIAVSLIKQESGFQPYAIGLDGHMVLKAQPRTLDAAIQTAERLERQGMGFSVGLSQIHVSNVHAAGLTWEQAFDPCTNIRYGQYILSGFYQQAINKGYTKDDAVFAALRGYNSGSVNSSVSNVYAAQILNRAGQRQTATPSTAKQGRSNTFPPLPKQVVSKPAPSGDADYFSQEDQHQNDTEKNSEKETKDYFDE